MVSQRRIIVSLGHVALASGLLLGTMRAPGMTPKLVEDIMSSLTALKTRSLSHEELTKMEASVQALVRREDPEVDAAATEVAIAQMQTICDTLIPSRKAAQDEDQKTLDDWMKKLKSCETNKTQALELGDLSSDMKQNYEDGLKDHADCLEIEEGKKLLVDTYCAEVDVDTVCSGTVADENKQCCSTHTEHQEEKARCVQIKKDYDEAAQQREQIITKACTDYDSCYDRQLASYEAVEKRVESAEDGRAWNSLYKIKCLLEAFKTADAAGREVTDEETAACDEEQEVPKIVYQEVPGKECGQCDQETCTTASADSEESAASAIGQGGDADQGGFVSKRARRQERRQEKRQRRQERRQGRQERRQERRQQGQ